MAAKTDFFKIGQISGRQPVDVAGAITKGLEIGLQPFIALEEKRKKADALTKQYIAAIPNVDAIGKIPDWMRSDVTNYLASEKQKYAATAKQLAAMDSSDPAYMQTLDQLQSIQNNFRTLNNQLNQFQEDTKEYIKASDNGNISKGFTIGEAENYNSTASIFTGKSKLNIQDGQLIFNVDGKNLNYSQGEVGDFYSPDFAVQNEIDKVALVAENDGLKGISFDTKKDFYARRIQTALQQGGKERLLSLVYDDDPRFATAAGLQTPQILGAINNNELGIARALIADELLKGIESTHGGFLKQYNKAVQKSLSKTATDPQELALNIFNRIEEDPVGMLEKYAPTGTVKKVSPDGNIITLAIQGQKDIKYNLKDPKDYKRFFVQAVTVSPFLANSVADRKVFFEFDNILNTKAKELPDPRILQQKQQEAITRAMFGEEYIKATKNPMSDLPILKK